MLEDRVILKQNDIFVVSDVAGDAPAGNEDGLGLYRSDTRFLSTYELRINGRKPILLNHSVDRAYVATFQLGNPTLGEPGGGARIRRQSLSIRRTRFVHEGMHERIGIQNCNRHAVEIELELRFDADFLDIFEVRGYHQLPMIGTREPLQRLETGLKFAYRGLDGLQRFTEVVFEPVPKLGEGRATVPVRLEAQQTFVLLVDILPTIGDADPEPDFHFDAALAALERTYESWNTSCTRYQTDNEELDSGVVWRNLEDLRVLCDERPTGLPEQLFYAEHGNLIFLWFERAEQFLSDQRLVLA